MDQNVKELFFSSLESYEWYMKVSWSQKSPFSFYYFFPLNKKCYFLSVFPNRSGLENFNCLFGMKFLKLLKLIISFWWRSETLNSTHEINSLVALWNFILLKLTEQLTNLLPAFRIESEENWTPDIMIRLRMQNLWSWFRANYVPRDTALVAASR